jgi:hypothetical protein
LIPSRVMLKDDNFSSPGDARLNYRVMLFNDMMAICKKTKKKTKLVCLLPFERLLISGQTLKDGSSAFTIGDEVQTYSFTHPIPSTIQRWIDDIAQVYREWETEFVITSKPRLSS